MPRESLAKRKERAARISTELDRSYPDADCALNHSSALQLLVATILSAQSTDITVNSVTPSLFGKYTDAAAYAAADPEIFQEEIHKTGFFRQKTKSVLGAARKIVDDFGGEVPDTMEGLITLPGVARKTANVILGTWFGKSEGIAVDTHVGRLAHRLKLTWRSRDSKDAVRIEQDLMEILPPEDWTRVGHAIIWHGRKICSARKANCGECTLAPLCPSAHKV